MKTPTHIAILMTLSLFLNAGRPAYADEQSMATTLRTMGSVAGLLFVCNKEYTYSQQIDEASNYSSSVARSILPYLVEGRNKGLIESKFIMPTGEGIFVSCEKFSEPGSQNSAHKMMSGLNDVLDVLRRSQ